MDSDDEFPELSTILKKFTTPRKPRVIYDSDDQEVPDSTETVLDRKTIIRQHLRTPEPDSPDFDFGAGLDDLGIALTSLTLESSTPAKEPTSEYFSCNSTPNDSILVYSPPRKPSIPKKIPRTPFRESNIKFWDEKSNQNWIQLHSPTKPKTPRKTAAELGILKQKKEFLSSRETKAILFLSKFITAVHPELNTLLTCPIEIVWSKTLSSTAGRATYSKSRKSAKIELSTKVIDNEERLESTMAHELCHILTWCVSNQFSNPHGREFKHYGSVVYDKLGLTVSTTHDYLINYKYKWRCSNNLCAREYGRHSKSLNPDTVVCGGCQSRIHQIQPVPRSQSPQKNNGLSRYQEFLQSHVAQVQRDNPGISYSSQIQIISKMYAEYKLQQAAHLNDS